CVNDWLQDCFISSMIEPKKLPSRGVVKLYIFSSADALDILSILSSTLDSVYSWFTYNRLSVNPSKTEHMLIGNPQQRAMLTSTSLTFCGNNISPVDSCRNLG